MTDHWIITDRKYHKHESLASAEEERGRLQERLPKKSFRIFRVKSSVQVGKSREVTRQLGRALEKMCKFTACFEETEPQYGRPIPAAIVEARAALAEWDQHQ